MNSSIASHSLSIVEEAGVNCNDEAPAAEAPADEVADVARPRKKNKVAKALDTTIEAFVKAQKESDDRWLEALNKQQIIAQEHQRQQLNVLQQIERNRLEVKCIKFINQKLPTTCMFIGHGCL